MADTAIYPTDTENITRFENISVTYTVSDKFSTVVPVILISTSTGVGMGLLGKCLAFVTIVTYRRKNSLEHIHLVLAFTKGMYIGSLFIGILLDVHTGYNCDQDMLCDLILMRTLLELFWRMGALVTVYLSLDRYIAIARPLLS